MSKAILTWDGFFIWYNGDGGEHSDKTEPHHRLAKQPILSGFLLIRYLLSLNDTPHYLTRYLNQFISHGRLGVSIMMRSFCIPWRQIKKPPLRVAQKIGGTGIPLISRNLAQRCVAPEFSTSIFLHRHCTTSSSFCKSMWPSFLIFAIRFSPFSCISDIEVYDHLRFWAKKKHLERC